MSDFSDISKVEQQLRHANNALHVLVQDVAIARTVKEFDSEQRRNLLALYTAPLLDAGESAVAAEIKARANPAYQEEIAKFRTQRLEAERAEAKWKAAFATFDAARAILAMSRETMRQLQG